MRLNRISSLNFYGKIIDSHVHVGNWSENGLDRILFGTDAPLGRFSSKAEYKKTINDIKAMIRREFPTEAEGIIDKIFYANAEKVFLPKRAREENLQNLNHRNLAVISGLNC